MFTYEELEKDLNIVATYEAVDRFDFKPLALHGMTHIKNVVNIVSKVLTLLGASREDVQCGKIAAYLHDLGMLEGKAGHAKRSVKQAKRILKGKDLTFKQKRIILNAIKYHSVCGKQTEIVGATLIFADKLDADKTRLGKMGYEVAGLKECANIESIDFRLIANTLIVNFITNDKFDCFEFEGYYHSTKIFNAVKVFAEFVDLDFQILLNDQMWKDKTML